MRLARVALGTVDAGVRPHAAVGKHVLFQVKLPPQAFAAFGTGEGLLSCSEAETHVEGLSMKRNAKTSWI